MLSFFPCEELSFVSDFGGDERELGGGVVGTCSNQRPFRKRRQSGFFWTRFQYGSVLAIRSKADKRNFTLMREDVATQCDTGDYGAAGKMLVSRL